MGRQISEGAEAGDTIFWNYMDGGNVVSDHIGGRCFDVNAGFGANATKNFTASNEIFWHFALKQTGTWTAAANFKITWYDAAGNELGSLRVSTLDIYVGTTLVQAGPRSLLLNTWYIIELHIKIADSGGIIEYKIDGVPTNSFTGDTKPGANTTVASMNWFNYTAHTYLDDLTMNDTSGAVDNSWCGDSHFYGLVPNGNGDFSMLVGSDSNSVDNYLLVDEIPSNGDTDYVQSATPNDKDFYQLANLPTLPAGSQIKRVIVETRAKETTADGQAIQIGIRSNSVESFSSNITVGTSYAKQMAEFVLNPDGNVAWTEAAINALQAGVKVV